MSYQDEVPDDGSICGLAAFALVVFFGAIALCEYIDSQRQYKHIPCDGYTYMEQPSEKVTVCHNGELLPKTQELKK